MWFVVCVGERNRIVVWTMEVPPYFSRKPVIFVGSSMKSITVRRLGSSAAFSLPRRKGMQNGELYRVGLVVWNRDQTASNMEINL